KHAAGERVDLPSDRHGLHLVGEDRGDAGDPELPKGPVPENRGGAGCEEVHGATGRELRQSDASLTRGSIIGTPHAHRIRVESRSGRDCLPPFVATLLAPKFIVVYAFVASALYVHWRGRVRHTFVRQLKDHSTIFAPYNALMYLFSAVPSKPFIDVRKLPELSKLRENWQVMREEALGLMGEGKIRAATGHNDLGFNSFFKEGWKRFYLTWYGEPLPSAQALCPKTVALLKSVPSINGAMFALLPPGGK